MIKKVKAFILPKTLENLTKGGHRKSQESFSFISWYKAILTLTEDGHIGIFQTTRRWGSAKKKAIESIRAFISGKGDLIVVLSDANASEDIEEVEEEIKKIYNPKKIIKIKIGIVVGTHIGTGIGITFYEEW